MVTNSIKTLKMVHIKKTFKKKKVNDERNENRGMGTYRNKEQQSGRTGNNLNNKSAI